MSREQYERLGIKQENLNTSLFAVRLSLLAAYLYAKTSKLEVNGSIPASGAGIFVANHIDSLDPLRMIYAAAHNTKPEEGELPLGRLVHGLGKSTLFGIKEPSYVKKRTGKRDFWNPDLPVVETISLFLNKYTIGLLLSRIGIHPLIRGTHDRVAEEMINNDLENDELVATSLIESRDGTGGLKGIKLGAAKIIKERLDTPFYLVAISKNPHRVTISEANTGRQLMAEKGRLGLRQLTMILADKIMDIQTEAIRKDWINRGQDLAHQELYPRAKIA